MHRRDLSKILVASAAGAVLVPKRTEARASSAPCCVRTAAEIRAKVTPTDTSYPPMWPERYGLNEKPGTTDMTAAVQAAIDVAKVGGGTVVLNGNGSVWPYLLTRALDCTPITPGTPVGFTIRCEGHMLADTNNGPYYPPLLARHTGVAVFDCTGSYGINFENVAVGTDTAAFPKTCFFLARSSFGNSQFHRFTNCRVIGQFSVAVLYNYGSEDDVHMGCYFRNAAGTPGTSVVCITGNNTAGLSSPFATVAKRAQSTIDHSFFGGQYFNETADLTSDVFHLEGNVQNVRLYGQWVDCTKGPSGGRALIYCDSTHAPINMLEVHGMQVENPAGAYQDYGIYMGGGTNTATTWRLDNCYLAHNVAWLKFAPDQNIQQLSISNAYFNIVNGGVVIPGIVSNSNMQTDVMELTIGTSRNNILQGSSLHWRIGSRTGDSWIDTSVPSWTPLTSALKVAGALRVAGERVAYHGQRVTVTCQMQASVSIACAAGTALAGLPIASVIDGECRVIDMTSSALIGIGTTRGSSMILPAVGATGHTLLFIAEYFCS